MKPVAEELAKKQKEISIAEFFEQNKQILGFDSLNRAMITSVKEAVDNALDACEEVGILPDVSIKIEEIDTNEYKIIVEDNGPGIVKRKIPHIFARLLYGSRFHSLRQARGQQGIGISAVVLYSQLSTGYPTIISSKIGGGMPVHRCELVIDTKKNRPKIISDEMLHWEKESGTRIEAVIEGRYVKNKKQSVNEYLRSCAIVNPHAQIILIEPDGNEIIFERATDKLPKNAEEIKPHPYGVELGTIIKMAATTDSKKITSFLRKEFSSISQNRAKEIVERAGVSGSPKEMDREKARRLLKAFREVKLMSPSTECLSPIGETLIKRGLKKETRELSPEFITTSDRDARVFSGNPFLVETGIVYGGKLPINKKVNILRFANRVPLLYQQGECVMTRAIEKMDWRQYGLEQRGGKGIPYGPAIMLVHIASTKIPFTSESKEAVASIPEIEREIKLSLQECARKMRSHLRKKEKRAKAKDKFLLISKILPQIAEKSASIMEKPVPSIEKVIAKIMDIIWIDDQLEYGNGISSRIQITNYKEKARRFHLYAGIPREAMVVKASPKPEKIGEEYIKWKINCDPFKKIDIQFQLTGIEKEDMDENDLYIKGLNPSEVIGADKWEGEE